jgi:hypothetical protein
MEIIQRDSKYFLQLANGELELTEQQVKKRVDRGDTTKEYLEKLEQAEQPPITKELPKDAQTFISSGKYFDNLIREFDDIYKLSEDKEDAAGKLIRFCQNSVNKLQHDRKNPKTDHVVIDYYILSWGRVVSFLQSLSNTEPEPPTIPPQLAEQQPEQEPEQAEVPQKPKDLTKQLLMIQLMQADGLFPISDALQGISHDDITLLIAGMLDEEKAAVSEAIQNSSAILLKRGASKESLSERISILEEMETYFEKLPYSNIISRIKLLIKIYKEQTI